MSAHENLPFPRGTTYFTGRTADIADSISLEGKEYWVADVDLNDTSVGAKPTRTPRMVKLRIVRNTAAIALLPKRVVRGDATAPHYTKRVTGYTTTTAERGLGVIDEYLPAAGCPVNDLCYIVIEGPSLFLTDIASGATNVIAVGGRVVALTAATSGATTAGRIAAQDTNVATSVLADAIMNILGTALSSTTTGSTNSPVLVDVGKW